MTAVYKTTYPVEVEYLERDEEGNHPKETIEIPYISSNQFFDVMDSPEAKRVGTDNSDIAILSVGRLLANLLVPGLLEKLSPESGIKLMSAIFQSEKETFGLGELRKPIATDSDTTPQS
jgi:hypothetical protein